MSKPQILCVHEGPDISTLVTAVLPDLAVFSARNCVTARELMKKINFALFLLEMELPDGSGLDLCRYIRGTDNRKPILFLLPSGSAMTDEMFKAGAQGAIAKDGNFVKELEAKISVFVGN